MLAAAEAHYAAALQAALAPGAAILFGPAPSVPVGASVQVLAEQLRLAQPSQDLGDERGAARHFTAQSWQGDGVTTSFPLPPGALEVAEVEAPPGFPRARGDDYRVDAGTLRFSRPPAMGIGVRALQLGVHVEVGDDAGVAGLQQILEALHGRGVGIEEGRLGLGEGALGGDAVGAQEERGEGLGQAPGNASRSPRRPPRGRSALRERAACRSGPRPDRRG